jgi:hypothetical protein
MHLVRSWRRRAWLVLPILVAAGVCVDAWGAGADEARFDGLNVIATPGDPFGSPAAKMSLANAKRVGARAIAVIPFLWQSTPASPNLRRGSDMSDEQLRDAIRDAHALGLAVLLKPQVWVPDRWAGSVAMQSEADWQTWFANYRREVERIVQIAAEETADAVAIGTELELTSQRPQWAELIATARAGYRGRLLYIAHNVDEAVKVPFWDALDAVGVTLYPPLGADNDRDQRRATMRAVADSLDALSARLGKRVLVGEVGVRSAQGAAAKPWESAEERAAAPDPGLQADVLADWLAALDRPSIRGVLIWRWLTDPDAGGLADTDFTVQGKPAERALTCAWTPRCAANENGVPPP